MYENRGKGSHFFSSGHCVFYDGFNFWVPAWIEIGSPSHWILYFSSHDNLMHDGHFSKVRFLVSKSRREIAPHGNEQGIDRVGEKSGSDRNKEKGNLCRGVVIISHGCHIYFGISCCHPSFSFSLFETLGERGMGAVTVHVRSCAGSCFFYLCLYIANPVTRGHYFRIKTLSMSTRLQGLATVP